MIEAIRGDGYEGDIAIDDVSFTNGCIAFAGIVPTVTTPATTTLSPVTTAGPCKYILYTGSHKSNLAPHLSNVV